MTVDVCFSPALYPAYYRSDAHVILTDIFRATTTIVTAFANGARSILPVATTREAREWKMSGWLVGAERNICRCSFADFGNSPFEYTPEKVAGQELVFTTTNGVNAIQCIGEVERIVAGAFINLDAVVRDCLRDEKPVTVLCTGWRQKINTEDVLFGGALASILLSYGYLPAGDATEIALSLWDEAREDLRSYVERTEHFRRLYDAGLVDDVDYCLSLNLFDRTPVFLPSEGIFVCP
jgi:2-phosphosulfolactate phosphatase